MSPSHVILKALADKILEQDTQWGPPSSYQHPSFDLGLTTNADTTAKELVSFYKLPLNAAVTRDARAILGELAWMDILVCEVMKLCRHHDSRPGLREQLFDVAAVALQWAAALDREAYPEADHEGPGEQP